MEGYILKSMERIDFQLSSQVSMLDEAIEAEKMIAHAEKWNSQIQWKIVSLEELNNLLSQNSANVAVFLTIYSLPYKNHLKKTYPNVMILEDTILNTSKVEKSIIKYEYFTIGMIISTLIILMFLSLIY
ncbi:hypothetical protein ACWOFR_08495 [Carnobacterium gallinarum]|uniref:hypothetical protein n=1 Tax=Carnobacterium gallinarum TaxID=2749 RepID=UPI0005525CA3|nr:hypothetical protein [Carnobacterium gallinarum]